MNVVITKKEIVSSSCKSGRKFLEKQFDKYSKDGKTVKLNITKLTESIIAFRKYYNGKVKGKSRMELLCHSAETNVGVYLENLSVALEDRDVFFTVRTYCDEFNSKKYASKFIRGVQ